MISTIPIPSSRSPTQGLSRLVFVLLVVGIAWFLGARLSHLVRVLLLASLLAFLLDPLVRRLESFSRMSRFWATLLVFGLSMVVLGFTFAVLIPVVLEQARAFQAGPSLEGMLASVADFDELLSDRLSRYDIGEVHIATAIRERVIGGVVTGFVPNALQFISDVVLVPFILFFLLKDWPSIKKSFIRLVPNRYFEFTGSVLSRVSDQIGNYLRGQAVAAIIVAVLVTSALTLIGVDYAMTIGVVAGLANIIPYIGPLTGAIVASLVSYTSTDSAGSLVPILIAFAVIQVVDNSIVQPMVVGRSVRIHPLLVVISVIAGGTLFGFWGLLLAVPFVVTTQVLIQESMANMKRFDFNP